MSKFYVHFTSIVSRYDHLEKVIESWLKQTVEVEKIIISVIEPSELLSKYNNPKVHIQYLDKDYGPSTKVYGALKYYESIENKDNVYIIICDDDIEYDKDFTKSYLEDVSNDNKNIYTHFNCKDRLLITDLLINHLQGADTYILNPVFLKDISHTDYGKYLLNVFKECPEAFYQDDYLISCYITLICKIDIKTVCKIKTYKIISWIDEMHRHPDVHTREKTTIKYLINKIKDGTYYSLV